MVLILAGEIANAAAANDTDAVIEGVQVLRQQARQMQQQLAAGVHVNPPLVVFGNPGGRLMSKNVMAIVYRHAKDNNLYVHGFGDADIEPFEDNGALVIEGLKTTTNVGMNVMSNGAVKVFGMRGQRIWADL